MKEEKMNLSVTMVSDLNKAFDSINNYWYNNELQKPVILVQSIRKPNVLGYCTTKKVWMNDGEAKFYEIAISAENFNRTFEDVICTLMHEAVHLYNLQNDIKDVSGEWHTKKFKNEAEKRGMNVEKAPRIGFSVTTLNDEGKTFVSNLEHSDIYSYHREKPAKKSKVASQRSFTYTCPICNEKIISKNPILDITCNDCDCQFER
jgi:hypothetical protein